MFSLHFSEFMEIFTLILMAVDHYVAICKPQKYMAIMSWWMCEMLFVMAWVVSCVYYFAQILLALSLPFSSSNVTNL